MRTLSEVRHLDGAGPSIENGYQKLPPVPPKLSHEAKQQQQQAEMAELEQLTASMAMEMPMPMLGMAPPIPRITCTPECTGPTGQLQSWCTVHALTCWGLILPIQSWEVRQGSAVSVLRTCQPAMSQLHAQSGAALTCTHSAFGPTAGSHGYSCCPPGLS